MIDRAWAVFWVSMVAWTAFIVLIGLSVAYVAGWL